MPETKIFFLCVMEINSQVIDLIFILIKLIRKMDLQHLCSTTPYLLQSTNDVHQDFQEQFNYYLNFLDDFSEDVPLNYISPPDGRQAELQENSAEQVSSNDNFKTVSDLSTELAKTQPHRQESSNHELVQQVIGEKTRKNNAKKRNDGNDFAQNNSSSARSMVCKMMASQRPKDWKKLIKDAYDKFLKENKVTNSQVVLIFTYLFLVKVRAHGWIYSQFRKEFLEHLNEVRQKADKNPDKKMRNALIVKIEANMELLSYIFDFKGQEEINFQYVKAICEPLFTGRQSKTIDKPLSKARQIQQELWAARNTLPCSYALPSDRKTSNTSTGCQVEL